VGEKKLKRQCHRLVVEKKNKGDPEQSRAYRSTGSRKKGKRHPTGGERKRPNRSENVLGADAQFANVGSADGHARSSAWEKREKNGRPKRKRHDNETEVWKRVNASGGNIGGTSKNGTPGVKRRTSRETLF